MIMFQQLCCWTSFGNILLPTRLVDSVLADAWLVPVELLGSKA